MYESEGSLTSSESEGALIIDIEGESGEASRETSVESRGQLKKKLNACAVAQIWRRKKAREICLCYRDLDYRRTRNFYDT